MSKAKTASKNNPVGRSQAKDILYEGKKVKPVKLITAGSVFFSAEYEETGDLVCDKNGKAMPWNQVTN